MNQNTPKKVKTNIIANNMNNHKNCKRESRKKLLSLKKGIEQQLLPTKICKISRRNISKKKTKQYSKNKNYLIPILKLLHSLQE
jgi:hypothetical protein